MPWLFENRSQAAVRLAQQLRPYRNHHTVAMAVGLGGVPVAAETACLLHLPLGLIPVVSLKGPDGLKFGALAPGGVAVVDWARFEAVGEDRAHAIVASQQEEWSRLERTFGDFGRLPAGIRTVMLTGGGMDTGMTMRAALRVARSYHPVQVVASAPVVSERAACDLREEACECVAVLTCSSFQTTGAWYREYPAMTEAEVLGLLDLPARDTNPAAGIVKMRERTRVAG
jgi:putative phosphoribosyl transferase